MTGKITWISPAKTNEKGQYYKLVHFQMLEGAVRKTSTHLVMEYRNYDNWKDKLTVGNILGGIEYLPKNQGRINADSPVYLVEGEFLKF